MRKENPTPNFIENEHSVLKFWDDNKCFEKLVEQNKNGERFRFLDGPITANNPMGIHHAWGRTLKDASIRYQAMLGKSCQYQNGFDAQGLWVEVETEKEIGTKDKRGIIEYGMDNFTEKCMERVSKFSKVITNQSIRLGQWMDWSDSYFTNTDLNITSIWHFLKKCHERGILVKSHRPMPWCPRCGTSLSEHEMSGSYKNVQHTSVYGKLEIVGTNDKILFWTTTPWTLTSNVALAVNPEINYLRVKVKSDEKTIIVGKGALGKLKGDIVTVLDEFKGSELVGKKYITVFNEFPSQNFEHRIVAWEDVDAQEGTGVVHIAPGCGAEDFELGKRENLPQICPIDDSGIILPGFGKLSGLDTATARDVIFSMMEESNKLYKTEVIEHSYPHCWRCKHEVLFKLVDEWNIATETLKPELIAASNTVKWDPDYAGKRMVDWLTNMGDWNISRKRFYGLPLPFYPCKECGHLTVVGSKEELLELSENHSLDGVPHLHRPYIDKIKIKCPKCGKLVERIPEVGDCWLDAGITPFSTKKYFSDPEYFKANFPSELVIEMKEQIRLWFYSQLFMSVVLTGKAPYEHVVTYSSVIQEDGTKFSKTGKMIKFDDAAEQMGADSIRYLYCSAPLVGDVRFGTNLTDEARRKIISLWNVYIFFNTYASIDNPDLKSFKPEYDKLSHSDKWLIERTNAFIDVSKKSMDAYKIHVVVKEFENFMDEVSNWYIRINRKRFWKSSNKEDQMNAYWCLYEAIKATIKIMAPIIPFITEYIYQNTVREIEKDSPISIHLSRYPEKIAMKSNPQIIVETDAARNVITIAQRMRNEAQIKVKQPLLALYVATNPDYEKAIKPLEDTIKDELNIKDLVFASGSEFNEHYYTVNFRNAGRVLKGEAQKLKNVVENYSAEQMKEFDKLYETDKIVVEGFDNLTKDMFDVHDRPKAGFIVSGDNVVTLALDTTINESLEKEGFIREMIRKIQVLRKDSGFAVEQRIKVCIITDDEMAKTAIAEYKTKIMDDILAVEILDSLDTPFVLEDEVNDHKFIVKLKTI
ncbi:MAG: isoleucine--tRNA ligase [Clostridia bacterium]|nr:isoleucine--tRNA ligase [Clostridia bacterium]